MCEDVPLLYEDGTLFNKDCAFSYEDGAFNVMVLFLNDGAFKCDCAFLNDGAF